MKTSGNFIELTIWKVYKSEIGDNGVVG